jgi:hypothetical protein
MELWLNNKQNLFPSAAKNLNPIAETANVTYDVNYKSLKFGSHEFLVPLAGLSPQKRG